ncbi:MAG: AarF/ABC1/UbiB kinase family protein [Desulfobacteraceae bacterium]|nr:AarF/ABC1/UbiB kinase family protein [Desulfobacteraceae bacterium]
MPKEIPTGKFKRSVTGTGTAARVGGKVLTYLAKRPFLSPDGKEKAKEEMAAQSGEILFQGLSVLRGTALKVAQQLSLELDLFPRAVQKELERSYHQVPPLNRALVSRVIYKALGRHPNEVFADFDTRAFAGASLGQVHRATSFDGESLAVKVQYPGMAATIKSDIQMIKTLVRPMPDHRLILPSILEIEQRLLEEIDYGREADNLERFKKALDLPGIAIPDLDRATSADTVLTTTMMPGLPLDQWLATGPNQAMRDQVAQGLYDLFLASLYRHHAIHADPNPGNFIIRNDLTIGVIDFGCIKHLENSFVDLYRQLPRTLAQGDKTTHQDLLEQLKILKPGIPPADRQKFLQAAYELGRWFGEYYRPDRFDFGADPGFMARGRALMTALYQLRDHFDSNPEFVYLDRTRYGLIRLFEKMKARVRMKNGYEWP